MHIYETHFHIDTLKNNVDFQNPRINAFKGLLKRLQALKCLAIHIANCI